MNAPSCAPPDASGANSRHTAEPLFREEAVQALFQPVEHLRTGRVVGFEALARLEDGGTLLAPDAFLPGLTQNNLLRLFFKMVGQAIAFLKSRPGDGEGLFVSINVDASLLLADEFEDMLQHVLRTSGFAGERLVLELLESQHIVDRVDMHDRLRRAKSFGFAIALDDIGTAYASLTNLRDLPIDIIKLDQSFARGLEKRPETLHFILSMLSLARGLKKRLVVEGVETEQIQDALRVLGVDYAQGYAIAHPMPLDAVQSWLAERPQRRRGRTPTSMLGAYASHLLVVETCRVLMHQPLPIAWTDAAKDPHICAIGRYFDRNALHDTAFGRAHKRFHEVLHCYEDDRPRWEAAAHAFHDKLIATITAKDSQKTANPS